MILRICPGTQRRKNPSSSSTMVKRRRDEQHGTEDGRACLASHEIETPQCVEQDQEQQMVACHEVGIFR